jgi:hypothetical protein
MRPGFLVDPTDGTFPAMSTNHRSVASTARGGMSAHVRKRVKRAAEPVLVRVERWMARRIVETVRQELAETREELSADLATLVELTVELERIAGRLEARLEATGARDTA